MFKIVEGLYDLCSENKGADQLRSYSAADLCLCFRICKKPVLSQPRSYSAGYALLVISSASIMVIVRIIVVVVLGFYVPVNNFSVILGRSHRFLDIYQYFGELKVSCSRTLHGGPEV